MSDLQLTGERTLPGIARENYWYRRHVAAYRLAARLVGGRVADVGAGEGYGAALLARRARVLGVDLDGAAVAHASRRYRRVQFAVADAQALPFRERSLDAIVCLQVVEHLTAHERFVAGASRALRPGGRLVVSTPNRTTFPAGLNPWHVREYDATELRRLLSQGFREVELLGIAHGTMLARVEDAIGEPLPHRLVRQPYRELPPTLRTVLRSVTSRSFRVSTAADAALDLVAVCTA